MTHPGQERGFTMIELMATVVILAILTAAALPSLRSFIVGQRIKTASFDVMSSLIMARSEAIKRNANVDVAPVNGSWSSGWHVVFPSGSTTYLNNHIALGTGLAITCYSGAASGVCPTITYNGNGRISGATAPSVQITANDASTATGFATRCINIDLSGRPNSKKANCP